jgi:hypothetical protein
VVALDGCLSERWPHGHPRSTEVPKAIVGRWRPAVAWKAARETSLLHRMRTGTPLSHESVFQKEITLWVSRV